MRHGVSGHEVPPPSYSLLHLELHKKYLQCYPYSSRLTNRPAPLALPIAHLSRVLLQFLVMTLVLLQH